MGTWYCIFCGGNHPSHEHKYLNRKNDIPLETPSHNGPYQGTLPVREVPVGVGSEDESYGVLKRARSRNVERLRRSYSSRKYVCAVCGGPRKSGTRNGNYCSYKCKATVKPYERQRRLHKPTKW